MTLDFITMISDSKRIVPVISLPDDTDVSALADTLANCGFRVLEITLRSAAGLPAIEALRKSHPQLIIGAGTVKTEAQLHQAIDAGAQFIVSPGIRESMVVQSHQQQTPIIPGVMTPSEIMLAENLGLTIVKLFPATLAGGTQFIQSIGSVFPNIQFFPTGGITEDSVNDYLTLPNVLCVGGTWLTPADLLKNGDWSRIHELGQRC